MDRISLDRNIDGNLMAINNSNNLPPSTDAQTKTGTSTGVTVTPSNMVHHQGVAKAWVSFAGATGTVADSYNVSSVTRTGTGAYTVNLGITMMNANYVPQINCTGNINITNYTTRTTTSFTMTAFNITLLGIGSAVDPTSVTAVIFGQF